MQRAKVNDIEIAYEIVGSGEPVLCIHGAHIADALRPLTSHPALDGYHLIRYHRRNMGASSDAPDAGPTPLAVHVLDASGLLDHLGIEHAHVVGHSLGGVIARELAADHSARVSSLALLEPALLMVPSGEAFAQLVAPIVARYHDGDAAGAVHDFLVLVGGTDWKSTVDCSVPGGDTQAVNDAGTFFESDLPASAEWTFNEQRAGAITCPVLSVLGTATAGLFVEGRELLHQWFPHCQDAEIPGASHMLQMEAPYLVATAVANFLPETSPAPCRAGV